MGYVLKRRRSLLVQLTDCVIVIKARIRHERMPLPEVLAEAGGGRKGIIGNLFASIGRRLSEYCGISAAEVWRDEAEKALKGTELTEEDIKAFERLGSSIGTADSDMQEEVLNVYLAELKNNLEALEEEIRQKTGFYRMMGVLAGIFVTVILL